MRYGFIGCGNMGGAVARAVCRGVGPENVVLANRTPAKAEALAEALGCRAATNDVVAQDCDVIFLGVKPQMMADMLAGIAPILAKRSGRFVLVTMAAGLSMARVREMAGGAYPIIRIMPNTPVSLGAGMIQYCTSTPPAVFPAAGPRGYISLLKHWPTAALLLDCPAPKPRNMPPRPFWAAPAWCWKAAATPAY